jgi:hypothetical protein
MASLSLHEGPLTADEMKAIKKAEWYISDLSVSGQGRMSLTQGGTGPLKLADLILRFGDGRIDESTAVWRDVEPPIDWLPLSDPSHAYLLSLLLPARERLGGVNLTEVNGAGWSKIDGDTAPNQRRTSGSFNNVWTKAKSGGGNSWKQGNTAEVAGDANGDTYRIDIKTMESIFKEADTGREYRLGENGGKLYEDERKRAVDGLGGGRTWQQSRPDGQANKGAVGAGMGMRRGI